MTKMEKLLDNVVDVSECCIIFSAAKNAEGELFIGTSQEIANSKIGKLLKEENDDFLIEVSKRFAKFAKENINFSLEDCAIDDAVAIINNIIYCCEENNWFNE